MCTSRLRRHARSVVAATAVVAGIITAPSAVAPDAAERDRIVHALDRLAYGPRPGDVERVAAVGLSRWIEQQLHPERIDDRRMDARLADFETLTLESSTIARDYFGPALRERRERQRAAGAQAASAPGAALDEPAGRSEAQRTAQRVMLELSEQRLLRAIDSERQLQEVLVDFWFNHFNVYARQGPDRVYVDRYERDTIRPHVFGRFRDLLGATASSPAMLVYLDNWLSADPDAASRRRPSAAPAGQARGLNENYARELLELHTLGVDGGYTQAGRGERRARLHRLDASAAPREGGGFRLPASAARPRRRRWSSATAAALAAASRRASDVLDMLATHPSTARFIATKLARRFVSDDAAEALVDRRRAPLHATAAATCARWCGRRHRAGVLRRDGAARGKVKTPFEFVASAVRATGADVATALPLARASREMGKPLYHCQPPTGYDERGDDWVTSGALLARMNFALALAARATARRPRRPTLAGEDLDALGRRSSPTGSPTPLDGDAATMASATTPAQAIALVIGAPEFQRK